MSIFIFFGDATRYILSGLEPGLFQADTAGHQLQAKDGDQVQRGLCLHCGQSSPRAGHFPYFLIFSIMKNDFLHFLSS